MGCNNSPLFIFIWWIDEMLDGCCGGGGRCSIDGFNVISNEWETRDLFSYT